MTRSSLRRWLWVHKWSSLVCTLFLLLICLTGAPLVFREELSDLLDDGLAYAEVPDGTPPVSIDTLADAGRRMYPGQIILSIFKDDDEPKVVVYMAQSWEQFRSSPRAVHWIRFDAHTGKVLKQSKPFDADGPTFLDAMLRLHRELFAGLPGELFLGAMALLFVIAVVSGIAVYGPFMGRLDFGRVRSGGSRRLKWLDIHNLVGVVTLVWTLVVGTTGVINELSTPLFLLWQRTEVKALLDGLLDGKPPQMSALSSPQAALDAVAQAFPARVETSVVFPGSPFGTPYHYVVWTKGREPLTSRLFSPVLVDAGTGKLIGEVAMPWYLRALELSRPLHFGDYGGLPLKIIWVLLDLVTIALLGSGLYLWLRPRDLPARVLPAGDVARGQDVAT
jgi:uncharacterized iron-regulated membrane protein